MPVYDDEKEKTITGNPADDELRKLHGEDAEQETPESDGHGGETAGAAGDVADREKAASKSGADSGGGFYNPDDKGSRFSQLRERAGSRLGGIGNSIKKHKWLWGIAGVGGAGFIGFILILFVLLSSLAIPNLAENITSYQFARAFIQANETNDRVIGQKIAIDTADQSFYGQLKEKYNTAGSKVSEQWAKLDKFQPNKLIRNMAADKTLKFNYVTSTWGGQRLSSITVKGVDHEVQARSLIKGKIIPGYKFVGDVKTASLFQDQLGTALRAGEVGPITRGLVAKQIRRELGISLTAWTAAKFQNVDEEKARVVEAQESAKKVSTPDTSTGATSQLNDDVDDIEKAQQEALDNPDQVKAALDNDGLAPAVQEAAKNVGRADLMEKALSAINPVYAVATPVCIVYDGSLSHSGSSIDARSAAQMKEAQYIQSAADQQKDGNDAYANAVQALGQRLGDDADSIPLARAGGAKQLQRSQDVSAQASPTGSYSLVNAIFGSGPAQSFANLMADKTCPILTNTVGAIGIGVANLLAIIFSGGTAAAGEEAAGEAASQTLAQLTKTFAARIAENFASKAAAKQTIGKTGKFIYGQAKVAAGIAAATVAAKLYVASKAGITTNGLETGTTLANTADAGSNLMSNQVMRRQFYGRPLDTTEVAQAAGQTQTYLAQRNASKNAYQRYFALDNPTSMLAMFGTSLRSSLRHFSFSGLITGMTNKLTSPASGLTALVNNNRQLAYALDTSSSVESNYGNVQIGWTAQEEALAAKPEYSMLENQSVLDASGKEDEIASTYGKCFDSTTMGTLLQDGDIVRDSDGNVIDDQGLCSPHNLGPNNPQYGDLVFRYRLAGRDNNGLDTVNDQQVISEDDTTVGASGGGGQYTFATYNIRVPGQAKPDERGHAPIEQRATRAAKLLQEQGVNIIGFQEIADPTRNALNKALPDFSSFPKGHADGPDKSWLTPVYWKSDMFKKVDQGYVGNMWRDCSHQTTVFCDKNPWVELEDKSSGQHLFVLSTHLLNQPVGQEHGGAVQRELSTKAIIDWANSKQSDTTPVIILGDFNSDYRPSDDDTDIGKNPDRIPYCLFSKAGYVDAYDAANNNKGYCPSRTTSKAVLPYQIDHIYISKAYAPDVTNQKRLHGEDVNFISDHDPIISNLDIPSDDGGSAQAGADFVGRDGFTSGWCTDYVKYILARHSSKYKSGSLGDGKDVASNLGRAPYNYEVNHTPAIHAVVSFPGPPYGNVGSRFAGHVALVGKINSDGSIVVEESNFSVSMHYGTHTVSASEAKTLTYAHTEVGWH